MEGAPFGGSCNDALVTADDENFLTKITVTSKEGKVTCSAGELKSGDKVYISYTGSGW